MWDPPEAISIWMQLIAERKASLAASGNPMEMELAERIVLSREQIANWHTSIQAWRRTADEANARRQNQLLLILNNLGLAVNTKLSVSDSVIDAWTSALITVDNLVSGKPQSVQTGAPLLGLSSWHLYPDMIVFGTGKNSKATKVIQNDPHIVRGGVLTLGIHDLRRSGDGIHWSLPLAYLRYYELRRLLDAATFKLSGTGVHAWTWVDLLASASKKFLEATGEEKAAILQLIRCGSRRYPLFLDDSSANQILGFSSPRTILHLLSGEAERVQLLRQIAKDFGDQRNLMIIQYRSDTMRSTYELASVEKLPSRQIGLSFDHIRNKTPPLQKYIRWVHQSQNDYEIDPGAETSVHFVDSLIPPLHDPNGHQWQNPPLAILVPLLEGECSDKDSLSDWQHARGVTMRSVLAFGDPDIAALYCVSIHYWTTFSPNYEPKVVGGHLYRVLPDIVIIRHVLWAFQNDLLSLEQLLDHFTDGSFSWKLLKALKALATAASLYTYLHNATVELRAAEQSLFDHQWVPPGESAPPQTDLFSAFTLFSLNREHMFACIARFESGAFNFHGSAMNGVLAISSGNSIYVASCLLQDPCAQSSNRTVERVVGNLGKTGMCLLVCPAVPQVRSVSEDIRLVNHYPFDGKEEDCFGETSLHLSFTEWQLPIDVGSRGNRDVQASYVEAAVGLYDRSKWVADLNILDVFNPQLCRIIPECREHRAGQAIPIERISEFVSIDSWEELLDSPTEVGVVRARGNWQGRLAAAALAIQRGHETRIVPEDICWLCCIASQKLPDTKAKENQDTHMADDGIGHIEWLSDDDGSDSETEELVADLTKRSARKGDAQEGCNDGNAQDGLAVNRNTVYIV
ncbi:hypothetical protein SLS60_005484 [Paraconiothyrium brasiliense]|uniref:Uncharacterized protein n=1 Tax=Paraconiothyrium brasiliense TaxID=300254 RepID=A0ABR3RHR8_9PLEO